MLVAPRAVFLEHHPIGMEPLVLLVRVIPGLALFASDDDDLPGHYCLPIP
jgi:hypothetical protein